MLLKKKQTTETGVTGFGIHIKGTGISKEQMASNKLNVYTVERLEMFVEHNFMGGKN